MIMPFSSTVPSLEIGRFSSSGRRGWADPLEMDRTLSLLVPRQFFLEGFDTGGYPIESDVTLERREIDQRFAVQFECRHLVADPFHHAGNRFLHGFSHLFKNALNVLRKGLDVFVYA